MSSYSGGGGGGSGSGGYDRRGSGGSGGYSGGQEGSGGQSDPRYDQRGYDRQGSGGYDRSQERSGYDQRGGSGSYDQRGSGYDDYRSAGGSSGGGGGYDQHRSGGGGSGYDEYSRGYDSRSGYGGQSSSGYSGSRDYPSSSGHGAASGGDYYSGSGSRSYDDRAAYSSGQGGSSSSGYGRYDSTGASSSTSAHGYKDEGRGYGGSSSTGYGSSGYDSRGYGSSSGGGYGGSSSGGGAYGSTSGAYGGGSSHGGYGASSSGGYGSRDDRGSTSSTGYSASSRGYDDRGSSSGAYGGASSDRYGGASSGSTGYDRRDDRGRDERRDDSRSAPPRDRSSGRDDSRSGGRDDSRGGGGRDRSSGRDDSRGGDRRDDRGGGFRGGGGGGRGGGRGGGGGGRGVAGEGAGAVTGSGFEQIGQPIQDPRLVESWSGQVPPRHVADDHAYTQSVFDICHRPNTSSSGRTVSLTTNYFGLTLDASRVREIYKYHVTVERTSTYGASSVYGPGGEGDVEMASASVKQEDEDDEMAGTKHEERASPPPLSKAIVRMVINEALRVNEAEFGGVKVAHDGAALLFAPSQLPWTHHVFKDINPNSTGAQQQQQQQQGGRGPTTFVVSIKLVETIPMTELTAYYGDANVNPQRLLQALDVVARHLGTQRLIPVGRNLFSMKKTHPLQGGKDLCWGYHQSIRIGQGKLLLNIDQAATVFYSPDSLLTLAVAAVRARDLHDLGRLDGNKARQLHRALRKIEVVPNHRSDRKRAIYGVSNLACDTLTFKGHNDEEMTVAQYFLKRYNLPLKHPFLPAVNVGNKKKATWLPLEVCNVAPGQRCANINELDTAEIIRKTADKPQVRSQNIMDQVHGAGFENDPYLQAFGLRVDQRMESVQARVLDAPDVQYKNVSERPHGGAWNLRDKEFVDGAALEAWGIVIEPNTSVNRGALDNFVRQFCDTARRCGMGVREERPVVVDGADQRHASIEDLMRDCYRQVEQRCGSVRLLMVIKRDKNSGSYGEIKRISDTVLGVPSQCIVSANIPKANPQYCANVCLKVNLKLSGKNSVLRESFPLLSDKPTIIIGADVEHPRGGRTSRPSIASVVASLDRYSAKYVGRVASQKGNDIQKLPSMLRDLLVAFYQNTHRKPERIVYYRDGVSDGQFSDTLQTEMKALRLACLLLEDDYAPPITYIVANKRHHMRAFGDRSITDRSGNLMPGTIVDTGIVDAHRFDFFLYGHGGLQGTSCPAHYTVLHDENKLSAEEVQRLTYHLCYTFQRCTRSVSIVPPVYYARLAATRAKYFLNETSDGASTIGSYSSNASNFEFAELHKNMLNCMFFA